MRWHHCLACFFGGGTGPMPMTGEGFATARKWTCREHQTPWPASMYDSGVEGEARQGRGFMNSEFIHEMLAMLLDGLDADTQLCGGLFVGTPFGDELQHVPFTGSQLGEIFFRSGVFKTPLRLFITKPDGV